MIQGPAQVLSPEVLQAEICEGPATPAPAPDTVPQKSNSGEGTTL